MRYRTLLISMVIIFSGIAVNASTVFELSDTVKLSGRPLYALVFGDYSASYANAPGFMLGVQDGFRFNTDGKLLLYPEFGWGMYYIGHRTETGRRLLLFPFTVSLVFDIKALNFYTKAGLFILKPYVGLGVCLADYRSDRKSAVAGEFCYQAGIGLEYTHDKMKGAFVQARVNHLMATNFREMLPVLDFSVGAGYAFEVMKQPSGTGDTGKRQMKIKISQ